jgi:recombination associated protein RdgC
MSMAFYKNAAMAHITSSRMLLRDDIEEALAKMLFRPLEKQQRISEGFVSPVTVLPADELTYTVNQCVFFAYRSDEKVIPKSAINQLVAAKAKEIEEKEQRKVGRKERKILQEQVLDEVTPNALPKQSLLRGYFDLRQRMLVVDSTSPKKLEELHGHLRSNLFISNGGGIAFQLLNVNATMSAVMSSWLLEGYTPGNFTIDDEGEIIAAGGEGAQIKIAKQDMEASDITQLLQAGRVVRKLAMTWNDRIGFVVATGFNLSKLHWHEKV